MDAKADRMDEKTCESRPAPDDPALRRRAYHFRCDVERCMVYHAHRRSFFDFLHKLTMLAIIVVSSAVIADFFGSLPTLGVVVAILAALDMVFDYSVKARDHEFLYRRYAELDADFYARTEIGNDLLLELEGRYRRLVADEPPHYKSLNALCHNEVMIAQGQDTKCLVPLRWWHRWFMHWVRFEGRDFLPRFMSSQEPDGMRPL